MLRTTENRRNAMSLPTHLLVPVILAGVAACGAGGTADAEREAAERVPAVRIVEPVDGAELSGEVRVVLAAENIEIVPAGDPRPNSGHHHLFLNRETTPLGEAIPAGEPDIVHLGQAQTEHVFRDLPPGDYTLVAVIGDLAHRVIRQSSDTVRFRVVGGER